MAEFCEECDGHHEPMPHNPLPCGCAAKAIVAPNVLGTRMENHHTHVVHCSMHAAAERMAACTQELAAQSCAGVLDCPCGCEPCVDMQYAMPTCPSCRARAILRDIAG